MSCYFNRSQSLGSAIALTLIGISLSFSASNKTSAKNNLAAIPPPTTSARVLDTALAHKHYVNSDFDQAIEILEKGLKEEKDLGHKDSVFIFKHLGVMYAAKYDTREKGKYYMHQLLTIEPTARILDMYASDMIYMIFKNIQDEYEANAVRYDKAESHLAGNSQTGPKPTSASHKSESEGGHTALYWVGGTGIAVVAGVAAYFAFVDAPKQTTTVRNHNP
ncbi:MAG: hypothetical protein M3Y08_08635 [Fibrobacterota bacterium]|nr:hypothetical protein [Fibrobacterota bacterium]